MVKKLIILSNLLLCNSLYAAHIVIIGSGYAGLTCAAILAHAGHTISCIDTNHERINTLNTGTLPFYEPGLGELLFDAQRIHPISFSTSLDKISNPDIYYVCVPTPVNSDGACDCSYLYTAYDTIIQTLPTHRSPIICIKSTVPPGTMKNLYERTPSYLHIPLVYNPEFMREGSALHDMRTRNPIVLGTSSQDAAIAMQQLLCHALPDASSVITTNCETAELIKYAWNSFSAMRIAYVNELADLCTMLGADIASVTQALAHSEQLLPTKDLKPGPGYGGSCLPKDTTAFSHFLSQYGLSATLVHRTIESNTQHKQRVLAHISHLITHTKDTQTITLLGLSFKANTNDIRNSFALDIIPFLTSHGITVKVYDPQAMPTMQQVFPNIRYCTSAYDAIKDSDGIIILTEWHEFKNLELAHIASSCRSKRIIDTRNMYTPSQLKQYGFEYITMGSV